MKDKEPTLDDLIHDFCGRPRKRSVIMKTASVFKAVFWTIITILWLIPASLKFAWDFANQK